MILPVFVLLLGIAGGQDLTTLVTAIDGFPIEFARARQPGTPAPANLASPVPVPLRPQTSRTIYKFNFADSAFSAADQTTFQDQSLVLVDGVGLNRPSTPLTMRLINPDSPNCLTGGQIDIAADNRFAASPRRTGFLVAGPAAGVNTNTGIFANANQRFIEHPELAPWICICPLGAAVNCDGAANPLAAWVHTNTRLHITRPCDGDANVFAADSVVANRCQNIAASIGLTIPVLAGEEFVAATTTPAPGTPGIVNALALERRMRTICCGWRNGPGPSQVTDQNTPPRILSKQWGVCINPNTQTCCSRNFTVPRPLVGGIGKPFNRFSEKCCFGGNLTAQSDATDATRSPGEPVLISFLDDFCPCTQNRANEYCNQQIPNAGFNSRCCTKTKYQEFTTPPVVAASVWGRCFDPLNQNAQCCDTGDLYDPGAQQCCVINGVQSRNLPCPCQDNTHCGVNQTCCRQTFPTPFDGRAALCNIYANFPSGNGPLQTQPCQGSCIDSRYQICCNGVACIDRSERCCNNTCCNRFTGHCTMGLREGAPNSPNNPNDYRIPFEICTTIEALTPLRALAAFVLPILLLFTTFVGLAATLFFAKRQNALQPLATYEKAMFAIAIALIVFTLPIFFSAIYKYGLVIIMVAFFSILAALSHVRGLFIAALVAQAVLLWYLVDPFWGNEVFTLGYSARPPQLGNSIHGFSGILHSIYSTWINSRPGELGLTARGVTPGRVPANLQFVNPADPTGTPLPFSSDAFPCHLFYRGYFVRDPNTEDRSRFDNPNKRSFGYCSRGYIVVMLVLLAIALLFAFLLFFVTLIAHIRNVLIKKADRLDTASVELEVRGGPGGEFGPSVAYSSYSQ